MAQRQAISFAGNENGSRFLGGRFFRTVFLLPIHSTLAFCLVLSRACLGKAHHFSETSNVQTEEPFLFCFVLFCFVLFCFVLFSFCFRFVSFRFVSSTRTDAAGARLGRIVRRPRKCKRWHEVRRTRHFWATVHIKMVILPRQARDKT